MSSMFTQRSDYSESERKSNTFTLEQLIRVESQDFTAMRRFAESTQVHTRENTHRWH